MMQKVILAIAATGLVLLTAGPTDPPLVKEGLWEVHTETTNNPSGKKSEGSYTLCRTHEFDQAMRANEKSMKGCNTVSENFQNGSYTSEIQCKIGATTIDSKGTTTFTGDTAIHSETRTSYSPAMGGTTDSTIVMDSKYTGACPDGVAAGDRTNTDGSVIHLAKK
jgi:hypothetical protein